MTYTHGHQEPVLRSHRWRTAENSCGYLLPHLGPDLSLLDVGCGPGSITADLAGRVGRVVGIDSSPEAIAAARADHPEVDLRVADLFDVEERFDVVHAHQVLQHVADPVQALREMRRVVRPGGIVAVMDDEVGLWVVSPGDPARYSRLFDRLTSRDDALGVQMRGAFRGRALHCWLERAGLVDVWQRTTLIERWAPLGAAERAYMGGYLAFLAEQAEAVGVPDDDLAFWRAQRDPAVPGRLVDHPEFYWCEANPVAVGRVPRDRDRQPR